MYVIHTRFNSVVKQLSRTEAFSKLNDNLGRKYPIYLFEEIIKNKITELRVKKNFKDTPTFTFSATPYSIKHRPENKQLFTF